MTVWPFLMGGSACLFVGGWLVGNGNAFRIGWVMLLAYVLMQLKKIGFAPEYGNAVSMLIWCAAASFLASNALINRENYGISLIPLMVAALLLLAGTCYLWAEIVGAKSGFLVPHALTSDLLAIAAMLIAGRGLGGQLLHHLRGLSALGATSGGGG